jgi:hypothetical protein
MIDIILTLTVAGTDTGPFDLYGNSTGSFELLETAVDKDDLTTAPGYSTTVPLGTTQVRIQSTGLCPNYIDVVLENTTTTTTTTTIAPTTTTTTTIAIPCGEVSSFSGGVSYPTTQSITLGSDTGTVILDYDAQSVPDRFIVEWNSSVVIDTGYRGVAVNYDFGGNIRSSFTSSLTGKIDPITLNTYPDFATYPDDGYPRILGVGLGTASFVKNLASDTFAIIKVYGPMSTTIWSYEMSCPVTTTTTTTCPTYYELAGCEESDYAFTTIVPTLGEGQQYVDPTLGAGNEVYYTYTGAFVVTCVVPINYNSSIQATLLTGCP